MRVSLCIAACLAMAVWQSASADCTYPKAPETIPNGSTASESEMVTAMTAFKQYNTDVTTYLACLDDETAGKTKDAGGSVTAIMQMKAMQAKKHNSAVAELKELADKFNSEVRTFKSRK